MYLHADGQGGGARPDRRAIRDPGQQGNRGLYRGAVWLIPSSKCFLVGCIRSDGAYLFAGENDYALVDNLAGNPAALGVFGYSFLDQNRNLIKGSSINGDRPSAESIASGRYSLVRPLYIYVKKNCLGEVPGLREYIEELTNEWTIGPDGYLTEVGLIPLPKEARKRNYYIARELTPLSIDDL